MLKLFFSVLCSGRGSQTYSSKTSFKKKKAADEISNLSEEENDGSKDPSREDITDPVNNNEVVPNDTNDSASTSDGEDG